MLFLGKTADQFVSLPAEGCHHAPACGFLCSLLASMGRGRLFPRSTGYGGTVFRTTVNAPSCFSRFPISPWACANPISPSPPTESESHP